MRIREPRRLAVVAAPALVAGLVLTACGSSDSGAPSASTIELSEGSTSYQTLPPATTTTVPAEAEGVVSGSQEYVVQPGDYPIKVANDFGVPLEDLINFNGWASDAEFPFPGETIKIPPGGKIVGGSETAAAEGTDTTGDAETTTDGGTVGEAIEPPTGTGCEPGSYTIAEGDTTRIAVANKFDITVEELDQANASTNGYSAFYPGLVIVIPPAADCGE